MLTDRRVRALKPGIYPDGNRLYLRVGTQTRTWIIRSRAGGGDNWIVIGHYPQMTLLEARNKAAEHTGVSMTVQTAFEYYEGLLGRDYKRPDHTTARFKTDILPELGTLQLSRVTRAKITDMLQKIVDRGSPVAANRTLTDVKRFFDACVEKGWINGNPASGISRRVVGGAEKHKERVLTTDELKALIAVLYTDRFALKTRLALGLVLLTGQRSSEVLGLQRSEVRGCWWVIPKFRMKQTRGKAPRRDQKVYLSPQARVLVRYALKRFGAKPFTAKHLTLSQAVARMGFDPAFTPHDLRRTMTTHLNEYHGVMPHVTEQMLYHLMTGVMAVYNHAEYLRERREAWRVWGRELARLRRGNDKPDVGQGVRTPRQRQPKVLSRKITTGNVRVQQGCDT